MSRKRLLVSGLVLSAFALSGVAFAQPAADVEALKKDVQAIKEGQQASTEALVEWCRARCANFKVPRYLAIVDSFEHIGMTGSSKVQKNKLRDHAVQRWKLGPAATPVEEVSR